MKYAVIQTGGKQYRVSEGDVLDVELLSLEKDSKHTFNDVLLYSDGGTAKVGTPFIQGISVGVAIVDHVKGEKIRVAKFKAKARYRRVTGHRQSLTRIRIEAIQNSKESKGPKETEGTEVMQKVAKPKTSGGRKSKAA